MTVRNYQLNCRPSFIANPLPSFHGFVPLLWGHYAFFLEFLILMKEAVRLAYIRNSFCLLWYSTANILLVLSTAFGSVTFLTVILPCMLLPKIAIDLKLYSSMSASVMGTAVGCDNHYLFIMGSVIQPMTVNWPSSRCPDRYQGCC